jgi:hypothetical protein
MDDFEPHTIMSGNEAIARGAIDVLSRNSFYGDNSKAL